jgi:hypothetical protein
MRQKFAYMALCGLLVLAGHVLLGLVVRKAMAQSGKPSAEFDTLTVRSLSVVDAAGRVRARLEITKRPVEAPVEDMMQVFNGAGVSVYLVGASSKGGWVSVRGNDGNERAATGVDSDGGYASVYGNNGVTRAGMRVLPEGGTVFTYNRAGRETGSLP